MYQICDVIYTSFILFFHKQILFLEGYPHTKHRCIQNHTHTEQIVQLYTFLKFKRLWISHMTICRSYDVILLSQKDAKLGFLKKNRSINSYTQRYIFFFEFWKLKIDEFTSHISIIPLRVCIPNESMTTRSLVKGQSNL